MFSSFESCAYMPCFCLHGRDAVRAPLLVLSNDGLIWLWITRAGVTMGAPETASRTPINVLTTHGKTTVLVNVATRCVRKAKRKEKRTGFLRRRLAG